MSEPAAPRTGRERARRARRSPAVRLAGAGPVDRAGKQAASRRPPSLVRRHCAAMIFPVGTLADGDALPVRVRSIPGKGRGVVATRRLSRDELIERAPVVVIPDADWSVVEAGVLSPFCFQWDGGAEGSAAIALGHASMCNHSFSPNAYALPRRRERVIDFIALREIAEGEEVTINYNGDPDGDGPMAFPVRD